MSARISAVDAELLLSVHGASKTFAGGKALDGPALQVWSGEVVAIVGHNGSGKSTFIKLLAGVYDADPGSDLGVRHEHGLTRAVIGDRAELHFIHQDPGLVEMLSTVENLHLAPGQAAALAPVRRGDERRRALDLVSRFGASFDVDEPVSARTAAERAVIAIARATNGWTHDRNILFLDEPTEALHGREVERLFAAIRAAVDRGAGVVFVSHRLEEVLQIADRVVVLRDGRQVAERQVSDLSRDDLLGYITGGAGVERVDRTAEPAATLPGEAGVATTRLAARGLRGGWVHGVDLTVRAGEVVGISGLLGSGREDVTRLIFGDLSLTGGTVEIDGAPLAGNSPAAAVTAGVAFAPGDRAAGVLPAMSVRENITLPSLRPLRRRLGRIDRRAERAETAELVGRFEVRPADPELPLGSLSGGNQQKAVLAKWIRNQPSVLLLDEPTQGVDAGSKVSIYNAIARAARDGAAVLVSSSDTEELVAICDRVLVLQDGAVSTELNGPDLTHSRLVRATL